MNLIDNFPIEIWDKIFNYCDIAERPAISLVCKTFHAILNGQSEIFRQTLEKKFSVSICPRAATEKYGDFLHRCRQIVVAHLRISLPSIAHEVPQDIKKLINEKSRTLNEMLALKNYLQNCGTLLLWDGLAKRLHLPKPNLNLLYFKHTTDETQLEAAKFSDWFNDPKYFAVLKKITFISFLNYSLISIPSELGKLDHLKTLTLCYNSLKDLPDSFQNLKKLSSLDLSGNQFTTLPRVLSKLPKLNCLNLSFNKIKQWPKNPGFLSRLSHLYLDTEQKASLPKKFQPANIILQ